ncbi:oxidoreductase [Algimonas ampicilliniresistens]|jgi:NAD(P)-dependent dehydrogenase (short-subunit alcohol dehydrogenase family)|uniref:Oxidoreductase n=1 Tax=Algimonas ampicilliniresistens TaxID=1298735 RepID=A0ABQ5V918_9PROT|nr:SDR family NAD(P)-dependent oxidoreductase [Algimonas ampicilliniresistens]GLQ23507.1 oxidoreductase [Algimonas ampicilliniresistens]
MTKPLDGRITLVTGASRGIGYAAAKALAAAGSHIVALARTQGGLEDLDDQIKAAGGTCSLVPMDLREFDQIDRLGGLLHERYGRLDGLLCNAAVLGDITPANHTTPKDWMRVIDVNMTAPARLIRSLDPLLRESDAGRAVFMTSSVAQAPRAYWGAYAASKAGMETFVRCWAEEIGDITNIKVNLLNPGGTRTQMRAKAMPGEDPSGLPSPDDIAPLIVEMLSPTYQTHDSCVAYRDWAVG